MRRSRHLKPDTRCTIRSAQQPVFFFKSLQRSEAAELVRPDKESPRRAPRTCRSSDNTCDGRAGQGIHQRTASTVRQTLCCSMSTSAARVELWLATAGETTCGILNSQTVATRVFVAKQHTCSPTAVYWRMQAGKQRRGQQMPALSSCGSGSTPRRACMQRWWHTFVLTSHVHTRVS